MSANNEQRSKDHESSALQYLAVAFEASNAIGAAAGMPDQLPAVAVRTGLLAAALGQAAVHAQLATAAAVRALTEELESQYRARP